MGIFRGVSRGDALSALEHPPPVLAHYFLTLSAMLVATLLVFSSVFCSRNK